MTFSRLGWWTALALACQVLGPLTLPALAAGTQAPEGTVTVDGRIVCLDDSRELQDGEGCNDPETARFALRGEDGQLHYFIAEDPKAGMFRDPRVRSQELRVVGWPRSNQLFEILDVYSLKEGKPHHIHYRCDVCDITATAPGPCWCCRQDFELREVAVTATGHR